jgi:Xaa-Pro aminopeptidase
MISLAHENERRARTFMAEHSLDALWLRRVSSFAWITGGASSYVTINAEFGAASAILTPGGKYIVTNTIEAPRLEREERLGDLGFEFRVAGWHEANEALTELVGAGRLGVDGPWPGASDISADLARLRARLTPAEDERFRELGRLCGEAIQAAARQVRPGMTEYQVAALVAGETLARGVTPVLHLVGADERVAAYRHPLPTDKKIDRYVMLVLCGLKWGLIASVTRLVHFGSLSGELRRRHNAVTQVDATLIAATRPGARLGDVFRQGMAAYAEAGFPDEWKLHHQGGPAGYEGREYKGTPDATEVVETGQVFAWNPSITGTKSEDTILIGAERNQVLTAVGDWPAIQVEVDEQVWSRPDILVV